MTTFVFPTTVTKNGNLSMPPELLNAIPRGSKLQITLHVEQPKSLASNEITIEMQSLSIEEYSQYLRSQPLPSSLITPASGLLGIHLADSLYSPETDFDEATWNQQWDQLEQIVDDSEKSDEESRLHELLQDLR